MAFTYYDKSTGLKIVVDRSYNEAGENLNLTVTLTASASAPKELIEILGVDFKYADGDDNAVAVTAKTLLVTVDDVRGTGYDPVLAELSLTGSEAQWTPDRERFLHPGDVLYAYQEKGGAGTYAHVTINYRKYVAE